MVDVGHFKKKLLARKRELTSRLEEIEHDLVTVPNPDVEERATEREGDEVLESLGNAGLMEIKRIDAALARIEAGTYGECMKCGEEISPERLEAIPDTPFCRDCA